MRKSTERNRIKRMRKDARMLFMHGLISSGSLDKIQNAVKTAENKLR